VLFIIKKSIKHMIFDWSWRNIFLIGRLKTFNLPIQIFRCVYFKMGKDCKITTKSGKLLIGKKWNNISRYIQSDFKICDNATLEINGNMSIFGGCSIDICPGGTLSLGKGYINHGVRIVVYSRIQIGNNVAISENVTFRDSDNHVVEGSKNPATDPITIEDDVWIGINVTILKGVTVGAGSVIAANSLVNKDVPPRTLVAGVPAKVIKQDVKWK
jgi:acetyltransferase-like isoleucine patch superfamily enzyme